MSYDINELMKLDYEKCNKLRFGFRDTLHKYALMYIIFISAYLAYGKFVLKAKPDSPIQENILFLIIVGIIFGIALSISAYIGFRVYCRNRMLSVCAIRAQQIIRANVYDDNPVRKPALLSGLKVFKREGRHRLFIPHSVSRGEYHFTVFMCIATATPILLSFPYYNKLFSLTKEAYFFPFSFSTYLLVVGGFLWWLAYSLENTIGHLSEANAIVDGNQAPTFPKDWINFVKDRDKGYDFLRKESQKIFYRGYLSLFSVICIMCFLNKLKYLKSIDIASVILEAPKTWFFVGVALILGGSIHKLMDLYKTRKWISIIIVSFTAILFITLLAITHIPLDQSVNIFLWFLIVFCISIIISKWKLGRRLSLVFGFIIFCFSLFPFLSQYKYYNHLSNAVFYLFNSPVFITPAKFCKDIGSSLLFVNNLGKYSSTLIIINISLKLMVLYYLIRIIIFVYLKYNRFARNHIILQTQALFASSKKYGIYIGEKEIEKADHQGYILNNFAYYIYKHNCYTYKKVFHLEDYQEPGKLYEKIMEENNKFYHTDSNSETQQITGFLAKCLCKTHKYKHILLDCWEIKKIKEDLENRIKNE